MAFDKCPHCGVGLIGKPINEEYLFEGLYAEGTTHYRREIGVQVRGVYDGVLYWQCPDCGGKWHRFPEGHYIRQRAEPYVNE